MKISSILFVRDHHLLIHRIICLIFYELFAKWAYEEDRLFWAEAAKVSREFMKKSSHPKTGMSPEYVEFDGSPVTRAVFEWGRHDWFYSDAYRTAANIGLDYSWFQTDVGQTQAVSRLQYTLGVVNKENPYMTLNWIW